MRGVLRREVGTQGCIERPVFTGEDAIDRLVCREGHGLGDELVPVLEMHVEPAVREPHGLHERRNAHGVETVTAERQRGGFDDASAYGLLVAVGVPHGMMPIMSLAARKVRAAESYLARALPTFHPDA